MIRVIDKRITDQLVSYLTEKIGGGGGQGEICDTLD